MSDLLHFPSRHLYHLHQYKYIFHYRLDIQDWHLQQYIPGIRQASVFGETLHLNVKSATEIKDMVETRLREAGFTISEIGRGARGMEDVFIEYMARAENQEESP